MNKNACINRKELKLKIVDIAIAGKEVFNSFEIISDGMSSEIKVSINKYLTSFVLCSMFYSECFIFRLGTWTDPLELNIFGEKN